MVEEKIVLPDSIRSRIANLYQEVQALQARISEIIMVALEAKGVEGVFKGYDLSNGVALVDAPDIKPESDE